MTGIPSPVCPSEHFTLSFSKWTVPVSSTKGKFALNGNLKLFIHLLNTLILTNKHRTDPFLSTGLIEECILYVVDTDILKMIPYKSKYGIFCFTNPLISLTP